MRVASYDRARWTVPVLLGTGFAIVLCAASMASTKSAAVVIGAVALLALWPLAVYFRGAVEELSLFALALTLSISLKFHPIFRADHIGGSIGLRISITELLLIVLTVAILYRKRRETLRLQADTPILVAVLIFWILALLSTIFGLDKELGIFELIAIVQSLAAFVFIVSYVTTRRRLVLLLCGSLCGLCLQSAITIVQFEKPDLNVLQFLGAPDEQDVTIVNGKVALPSVDLGTTFVEGEVQQRPAGLLIHPNVLAFYLVLSIPTALGVFLVSKSRWLLWLSLVALLLSSVALYASLSRSGWAGTLFALLLAAVLARGSLRSIRGKKLAVLIFLGSVVCLGLALNAGRIYSRIFDTADEALQFRENLASIALNMIQAHPLFGVGLNSFAEASNAYDPSGVQRLKTFPVHDLYLLEASETGVPGGLAFLAVVWLTMRQTFRAARDISPELRLLPILITASIAGFWFGQISDFVYRIPILTTILWVQVALAFAASRVAVQGARL